MMPFVSIVTSKRIPLYAAVIVIATFLFFVSSPSASAAALTCTWPSASGTGNWSDTAKWQNCSSQYPGQSSSNTYTVIIADQGTTARTITLDVAPANPIVSLTMSAQNADTNLTFGTNSLTTTGDVTINTGVGSNDDTIVTVGAGTLTIGGNLIYVLTTTTNGRTGDLRITTGSVSVAGNIDFGSNSGRPSNPKLSVSSTGSVSMKGDFVNLANGTVTLASGSTFIYNGTAAGQTVVALSYSKLQIDNTNASGATTNAAISVGDTLTVGASGKFNVAGYTFTVTGVTTLNGALNISSATAVKTFTGAVTVNSGGSWSSTGNSAVTLAGGFSNSSGSTIDMGTGTYSLTANQTINGNSSITFGGGVTLSNNVVVTNNNTATVTVTGTLQGSNTASQWTQGANSYLKVSAGAMPNNGNLDATASGNTVEYAGTAQDITAGGFLISSTFVNLKISGSNSTSPSVTVTGTLTVTGTFTPAGGTITRSGTAWSTTNSGTLTFYNLTIAGTPATQPTASYSIAGALTVNSGITFAPTSGTITMSAVTSNIANNGGATTNLVFKGLTIAATPTAQTQYNSSYSIAGALTVNGSVTFAPSGGAVTMNNGSSIVNGGTLTFFDWAWNPGASIVLPATKTITIANSLSCTGSAGNVITITSSSGGSAATLSMASGTVDCDYLSLTDSDATGGATWYAGANSGTGTRTSGWIFTALPRDLTISTAGTSGGCSGPDYVASASCTNVNNTAVGTALGSGSVSFTATGNITVTNGFTKSSGSNATTTFYANGNIAINDAITSSSGTLGILLNADRDANTSGYINVAGALTSNGGMIIMGGGSGTISPGSGFAVGNSGQAYGVIINAVAVAAGGGNVIINGQGYDTTTDGNGGFLIQNAAGTLTTTGSGSINVTGVGKGTSNSGSDHGVNVYSGSVISAVNGGVTVTGTGGGLGTGTGNYGVMINANGSSAQVKTTGTGAVVVSGTGGNPSGSGLQNFGIYCASTDCIQTTDSGTMNITGVGGNNSGGSGNSNHGIYVAGTISGGGGAMTLNGTGGASTGVQSHGINVLAGTISNTGTGTMTLTGTAGGTSDTASGNRGLVVSSGGVISTVNGDITMTATGGGSGTVSQFNYGVNTVDTGSTIKTTGSGNLIINGVRGQGDAGTNYGARIENANGLQTTGTGTITLAVDTIYLDTTNVINSATSLTIKPYTATRTVGVGSGSGSLALTDTWLNNMNYSPTGTLTIGSTAAGTITINSASTTPNRNLTFLTAGDISLSTTALTHNSTRAATTTFNAYGNVTLGSAVTASAGTLGVVINADYDDNASGSFTSAGGITTNGGNITVGHGAGTLKTSGSIGTLTVNTGSNTVTLGSALTANNNVIITSGTLDVDNTNNYNISVAGSWSNAGTFLARAGTVTFAGADGSTQSISGATTFYNASSTTLTNGAGRTLTFQSGVTQAATQWTLLGYSGKLLTIRSTTGGSAATLSQSAGTVDCSYCSIQDITATGGATWNALTGMAATLSGNIYDQGSESSQNATPVSVSVSINNAAPSTLTNQTTSYEFTSSGAGNVNVSGNSGWNFGGGGGISFSPGDKVMVYIDGDASLNANSFTIADSGSITDLNLYIARTAIYNHNSGSTTNVDICSQSTYPGSGDYLFTCATNVPTYTGDGIIVAGAYAPGGNVTTPAIHIDTSGTYTGGTETLTVNGAGGFTKDGTFTANTNLVKFTATATTTGSTTFNNLEFNNTSGTWRYFYTAGGTISTVNGTLTLSGTFPISLKTGDIYAKGDINVSQTYNTAFGGGTTNITLNGTGNQTITGLVAWPAQALPKVTINKSTGNLTFVNNITFANDFTVTSLGSGTLTTTGSTLIFYGSLNMTGSMTFNNLQFHTDTTYGAAYYTIGAGTILTVNGSLTISGGRPVILNTGDIYAKGDISITNGFSTPYTGDATITINGTTDQLVTGQSSGSTHNCLPKVTIDKASGILSLKDYINLCNTWLYSRGTVDATTDGSTVLIDKNLTMTSAGMSFNNLELQNSSTLTLGSALDVLGTLTVTSYTLAQGAYNITAAGLNIPSSSGRITRTSGTFNGGTITADGTTATFASNPTFSGNVSVVHPTIALGAATFNGVTNTFTATGDITVSGAMNKTAGSNATTTLYANGNIITSAAITSTNNALNLLFNADRDANTSGYINIGGAITTNGGDITIGGGSGTISAGSGFAVGNAGQAYGVIVNAVAVAAGGGNVIINGQGYDTTTDGNGGFLIQNAAGTLTTTGSGSINVTGVGKGTSNSGSDHGVNVYSGSVISAVNGGVTVTGTGGGLGTGTGNYGVIVNANGISAQIKTTGTGTVTVSGTGGNSSGAGGGNFGIYCVATDCIQTAGSGLMNITGVGGNGSGGSGNSNHGIYLNGSTSITGGGGAMTITGTGGATTGIQSHGVNVLGGTISNTGTGTITFTATGGGVSDTASGNRGLVVSSAGVISTVNGDITMTATGGGTLTTSQFNYGVNTVDAGSTIKTTGSGNLIINGVRGQGDVATNYGARIENANGLQTTGTGTITLAVDTIYLDTANAINSATDLTIKPYTATRTVGVGSGSGSLALTDTWLTNMNYSPTGTLTIGSTTAGSIAINTASSTLANRNLTFLTGGDVTLATTALTHNGTAAATTTMQAYGNITNTSAVTATNSALNVLLQADYDGNSSGYVNVAAGITSNGGNITMGGGSGAISAGSGFAVGNAGQAFGVLINAVTVSSGAGNIIINGQGYSTTANQNYGVVLANASAIVTSSDGNLSVTGTGGGSGVSTDNYGIFLASTGGAIKVTGNGNLSVTGTGGNPNGSGGANIGVHCAVANCIQKTTSTGTLTVTGTGGNNGGSGSGANNMGVYLQAAGTISGSGGAMTITGTGGNASGDSNHGIAVSGASLSISNSGSGSLSVTGTGHGAGNSGSDMGVVTSNGGVISAADGTLTVTGQGGGAGTGVTSHGVYVVTANSAIKTTGSGNLLITGTGGNTSGTGGSNRGIEMESAGVISTANGNLFVSGTGGGAGTATSNHGIFVTDANSSIKTTGSGNLSVYGTKGNTGSGSSYGVNVAVASGIQTAGTGSVTVAVDDIFLSEAKDINSANDLTIGPKTAATTVGVGSGSGTLSLTDTFLGRMNWSPTGTLTIGTTTSGNMAINTASTTLANRNLTFISGSDISLATSPLTHSGASAATTTFNAYGNITTTSAITADTSTLGVVFYPDFDANASGAVSIGAAVTSNGGQIKIQGGGGTIDTTSAFENLTIALAGGKTVTPTVAFTDSGNLTVTSGTFNLTTNDPTAAVAGNLLIDGGTLIASNSSTLTVTGNWTNNGTFTHSSGEVVFNGTAPSQITGSSQTAFYSLTSTTAGKTLQFAASATTEIDGIWTLTGQGTNPINISSTWNGTQWKLYLLGSTSFSNIRVRDSGCAPSTLSVTLGSIANDEGANESDNDLSCWPFSNRYGGGGAGGGVGNFAPGDGPGGGNATTGGSNQGQGGAQSQGGDGSGQGTTGGSGQGGGGGGPSP